MIKISHTQNITVRKLIEKEKSDGMPFSSDAGFIFFLKREHQLRFLIFSVFQSVFNLQKCPDVRISLRNNFCNHLVKV